MQAPIRLSYVAARAGYKPADPGLAFRYLELGCGSGVTLNGLAAACPHAQFIGMDINAENIQRARRAAAEAGLSNVSYVEAAFSEIAPASIGQVDYVACAGTFSWLQDGERRAVIRLLDGCLVDGGVLFLSFVTLGRAAVAPLWRVLRTIAPARAGRSVDRLRDGIRLLGELRDNGARYFEQHPTALTLFNEIYTYHLRNDTVALENLSHNLLADGFRQELLDEVVGSLSAAGMRFCGSALPDMNDPDLCVPGPLRRAYDALPDSVARAVFLDFLAATNIRTDVFVRNGTADADGAQHYLAQKLGAIVLGDPAGIWQQLVTARRTTFDFSQPVVRFVFERIAAGEGSLGQIADRAAFPQRDVQEAWYKLTASPGMELCLAPSQPTEQMPARVRPASRYNRLALDAARAGAPIVYVAAPGLGNCLSLGLPWSLLVAELCESAPTDGADRLHATLSKRVAGMAHLDPAIVSQLTAAQSFEQLYKSVCRFLLPTLLRIGALEGD